MRYGYILCALLVFVFSFSSLGEDNLGDTSASVLDKEAEIEALKKENSMLRRELAEVLLKNKKLENEALKLQLGIMSVFPDADSIKLSDRELQILKDMLLLRESLKKLCGVRDELSRDLQQLLDGELTDEEKTVLKAKIRVNFENLSGAFDKLALLLAGSVEEPNLEQTSVLDVDNKEKVITFSSGTADGAFCGLYLTAKEDNSIVVTIVAVRPFTSAGVLIEGKIEKIVPGMIFVSGKRK